MCANSTRDRNKMLPEHISCHFIRNRLKQRNWIPLSFKIRKFRYIKSTGETTTRAIEDEVAAILRNEFEYISHILADSCLLQSRSSSWIMHRESIRIHSQPISLVIVIASAKTRGGALSYA